MTETQVETPAETTQRGRPRPDATVERDARVLRHITENGAKNRAELADELELPGNQVYLSLYRLSRSDPPTIVKQGSKWNVPGAATPTE